MSIKKLNRRFTFEEKVNCVKDYLENNLTGKEIAIKYDLPNKNPSYVYAWTKIVVKNKNDYNALKSKIKQFNYDETLKSKIKVDEEVVEEKDAEIKSLKKQIKELRTQYSEVHKEIEFLKSRLISAYAPRKNKN